MLPATRVANVHTDRGDDGASVHPVRQRPTGYCVSTAARMLTAMNVATPDVARPLRRAYTGPMEKMMAEIIPETVDRHHAQRGIPI